MNGKEPTAREVAQDLRAAAQGEIQLAVWARQEGRPIEAETRERKARELHARAEALEAEAAEAEARERAARRFDALEEAMDCL